MTRVTPTPENSRPQQSHLDYIRGLLPDYVDPLPRSAADVGYLAKKRRFVVTAVVALLATWLLWPTPPAASADDSDSEVRVAEFLTAVRDRDVDAALAMTSGVPSGVDPGFLTPAAISDEWRFEAIEDTDMSGEGLVDTEVRATLVDGDGYGHPMSFELERESTDDAWSLVEPFVQVSFPVTALAYVEANGVRLPEPVGASDLTDPYQFAVFPGTYQFYSDVDSVVEVEPVFEVLVPGVYSPEIPVAAPGISLVDDEVAQAAVNAYVDHCVNLGELLVGGCPFGADRVPVPDDDDYIFSDVSKVEWEVLEYPTVTVDGDALNLTDRQRGEIKLTATSAGPSKEKSIVDCQIITDRLAIRVLPDGQLRVYPEGNVGRLLELDRDLTERETCDV